MVGAGKKLLTTYASGAQGSDIDFLVVFEELAPREHAQSYLGMIEDLESLFARRVDLIEERAIRTFARP